MAHVHADDVAQLFQLAVEQRDAAAGQDFFATAPTALTVRGYAHLVASWAGREARLESVDWDRFRQTTAPEHADASWEHLSRSQVFSTEKPRRVLGTHRRTRRRRRCAMRCGGRRSTATSTCRSRSAPDPAARRRQPGRSVLSPPR